MHDLNNKIYSISIKIDNDRYKDYCSRNICKYHIDKQYRQDILVFVNENGELYKTPFCEDALAVLQELGYTQSAEGFLDFGSNNDTYVWRKMCDFALKQKINEKSDQKGIEDLPNFIKGLSIKIPNSQIILDMNGEKSSFIFAEGIEDVDRYNLTGTINPLGIDSMVRYIDKKGDCYLISDIFLKLLKEFGYTWMPKQIIAVPSIPQNIVMSYETSDSKFYSEYTEHLELANLFKNKKISSDFIIAIGETKLRDEFGYEFRYNNNIGFKK